MRAHTRRPFVRVDLAFLNPSRETSTARRQFSAHLPIRRANTARQCGRSAAPPTTFYTLRTHTCCTQVRGGTSGWWWAQRKRPAKRSGAMPAARTLGDFAVVARLTVRARYPPRGVTARYREITMRSPSAGRGCHWYATHEGCLLCKQHRKALNGPGYVRSA